MLINLTIPVFNEEIRLDRGLRRLAAFAASRMVQPWEIVVADNGSTDGTLEAASRMAAQDRRVRVIHLEEKGRGRALRRAWLESSAGIVSYMDVDLSTELDALPGLLEPLLAGTHDVAVGSRLLRPEWTERGLRREWISRMYNWLIRFWFQTRFSDAQCGFKALTREAARELLPAVGDNGWFFDTELLIRAERRGYRIFDLPVRWVENEDSRVKILPTALRDLKGLWRLRKEFQRGAAAQRRREEERRRRCGGGSLEKTGCEGGLE